MPQKQPRFDGTITLKMINFGPVAVDLRANIDSPAQLMFFKLTTPVAENGLYGTDTADRFQGQTGPLPAATLDDA